ncbi:hypothetical protein [Mucisphaera calidilacus]|uniref:PEP-CTERM protein-sorting domain-containing protein n=1 Tax=Mucisphaera calidilacus TaxID=2527982 RepID=A0A518BV85_9BACT|nr:hypothetical protein [Mucisphaera calidilacus]QDU70854.1 hypothetical protein Pan265_06940 [Mucisphaera calidilacus]
MNRSLGMLTTVGLVLSCGTADAATHAFDFSGPFIPANLGPDEVFSDTTSGETLDILVEAFTVDLTPPPPPTFIEATIKQGLGGLGINTAGVGVFGGDRPNVIDELFGRFTEALVISSAVDIRIEDITFGNLVIGDVARVSVLGSPGASVDVLLGGLITTGGTTTLPGGGYLLEAGERLAIGAPIGAGTGDNSFTLLGLTASTVSADPPPVMPTPTAVAAGLLGLAVVAQRRR